MATPRSRLGARLRLAVTSARAASALIRLLGAGGGTAAPGRVANRVDQQALERLSRRLGQGVVVVAGTNGKTTTATTIADILANNGRRVVHNRAGANLVSGIVTALAADTPGDAEREQAIAVLEVDEAALPAVLERVSPRVVVLTNLFRDQLDRYGEIDLITDKWREALSRLTPATTLVVNADDPALVMLTDRLAAPRVFYGVEDAQDQLPVVPHAAEALCCRRCGSSLSYRAIFVGHLGDWYCRHCGLSRPSLDVAARSVELWSYDRQSLDVRGAGAATHFTVGLPGLYNTYNVVAALTAAQELGIALQVSQRGMAGSRRAFGRAEWVLHRGRRLLIVLVKNPVGADEVLRMISGVDQTLAGPVLFCLNDAAADGRDVSWIWDVDYEFLTSSAVEIFCAGSRWADMRNRLHYAGFPPTGIHALGKNVGRALDEFAESIPVGSSGFVLPTYTAMLAIQQALEPKHQVVAAAHG